jgi:hypothetical protein
MLRGRKSSVDLVLTMDTYDSNFTNFQDGIQVVFANLPLSKIPIVCLQSPMIPP